MREHVGVYDYAMVAFYFIFMVIVGLVYRSKNKNISDFFRSGGGLSWWLVGASAFVTIFSAWTFVGCAGKVYRDGSMASLIFLFNAMSLSFSYWLAPRIRRLRVITWVSAIKDRFGPVTEQFYAWITMCIGFAFGGAILYTLAVFLHPVFGISVLLIILVVGAVVTILAASGGTSALIASDFVQCLLIIFVAILTAFMVLRMPEVGGIAGLVSKVPSSHFNWSQVQAVEVLWLWGIAIFINQFVTANSVQGGCARYITVRNEKHARMALLIPFAGMIILPFLAFIPPLAATFIIPDIGQVYSGLNNPSEASYIAMAMLVLPQGMIGLLACAIFAASLTSLNIVLSVNSSVFVKNIYNTLLRKTASDKELLLVSKLTVLTFGIILTVIGIKFSELKDVPLFDLILLLAGLINIPLVVPVFLGLIIKRTPSWSSWSTVLIGFLTASVVRFAVPPYWFNAVFEIGRDFTPQEMLDVQFAMTVLSVTIVSTGWFLLTMLFYGRETDQYKSSVEDVFKRMNTPIDEVAEGVIDTTHHQAITVGILCMVYGTVILLSMMIPNDVSGRLCFVFCGAGMLLCGVLLYLKSLCIKPKKCERLQS